MSRPDIIVGHLMQVIMLDKPGGKRTGAKRLVRVLRVLYHMVPKGAIRSVEVLTVDGEPVRCDWVDPKYLVAIPPFSPAEVDDA